MRNPTYHGKTTLYISHGAGNDPDWFLVEEPEGQVHGLREGGRTVYVIKATPWRPRWRWWLKKDNRYWGYCRWRYLR